MHDSGGYVDVSTLLPFFVTLLLVSLGIVNLVKLTAARYLNPLRFEGESSVTKRDELSSMLARHDDCAVCQEPATKRCSRCKTVRYCSLKCQAKHWNQGHKLNCKASDPWGLKNVCNISNASGAHKSYDHMAKPSCNGASFAATSGNSNSILPKPKKVLFPYDEFVKLFKWDKLRLPPCGLMNCGNSCFANVVLQCLTYTRPLVAYLLEGNHTHTCKRNDWCFLCELQLHVGRVRRSENPFSPIKILSRIPNIGGNLGYGRQEDAHEFMRFAIDSMQSVCLDEVGGEKAVDPHTQETTLIQHIFGGHLQSQVKCTQCLAVSNRYENMMDLTVEIHGDVESLEDALKQFTVLEWLDGDNKYKCDRCNAYVKAWKRLTVHRPPNILTVALKRFQTGRFGKLNKRVTFPKTLDLSPYMSERGGRLDIYELYAVVVHVDMLNASYFGHYICYIKDLHGSWYKIDDHKVKEVELEEVLSQKAYMLLYSRLHVHPPPVADISGSPVAKDNDVNCAASVVQSQSHFASSMTEGFLAGPFEVVEPIRSNLDDTQEVANENISVLDSFITDDGPESVQRACADLEASNSADTDPLSVDMTSEESELLISNSISSEESSVKTGKRSPNTVLLPLTESKRLETCLFSLDSARKCRSASCPPVMAARVDLGISSPFSSMKHSGSMDCLNARAIPAQSSKNSLTELGFLNQNRLGDESHFSSQSKWLNLDTSRINDLTEDNTSRVSIVCDIVCPENMDCDYQVAQPSTENSCDSRLACLEEPEIADSSSQQTQANVNKTLFPDDNANALPYSTVGVQPCTSHENHHATVRDHMDWFGQSCKRSDFCEPDTPEDNNDAEVELNTREGTSPKVFFNDGMLGSHSLPSMSCCSASEAENEYEGMEGGTPLALPHINSTPAGDNAGTCLKSNTLNIEFLNPDGMPQVVGNSSSEQGSGAYDFQFRHTEKYTEMQKVDQYIGLENPQSDTLEAFGSSHEVSVIPVDGAKVVTQDTTQFGIFSSNGEPPRTLVKLKPILVPGFLKGPPGFRTKPTKNVAVCVVTADGTGSPHEGSSTPVDGDKLVIPECTKFDMDSRADGTGFSHENSSTPVDASKLVTPVSSEFDVDSGIEVMASAPCEATGTQTRKSVKEKPLFARGFLNRKPRLQTMTRSKKPTQMKVAHATQADGSSSENGVPKFQGSFHKEVSSNGTADGTMPNQNVEGNVGSPSTHNQKEMIGNGRKRALSLDSLHTEKRNPATTNTNEKTTVTKQKQVRNKEVLQ
eukprot:Gb_38396 [translate_table: standard]